MNSKKGISPLIATVLIVGFTIVLAVLVITWISGTVKTTTEDTDEQVTAQELCLDVMGKVKTSVSGSYTLNVNNQGSTPLSNITAFWLRADGTTADVTWTDGIAAFGTDSTLTAQANIQKVKIGIYVQPAGGLQTKCGEDEITISSAGGANPTCDNDGTCDSGETCAGCLADCEGFRADCTASQLCAGYDDSGSPAPTCRPACLVGTDTAVCFYQDCPQTYDSEPQEDCSFSGQDICCIIP